MEYTVKDMAKMSGVSARTIRYYGNIGLLPPSHIGVNGYRYYGGGEVDRLQQILLYREMGVELCEISRLVSENGDRTAALEKHLSSLVSEQERIGRLIANVKKTIKSIKGETAMTDKEKFEGFKKELIETNEKKYGKEMRSKYGDSEIDGANEKLMGMSREKYNRSESLRESFEEKLKEAACSGDSSGELAAQACRLHNEWICTVWKSGVCTKEAQLGLCKMYAADERFREYYDRIYPGAADFLLEACEKYCGVN